MDEIVGGDPKADGFLECVPFRLRPSLDYGVEGEPEVMGGVAGLVRGVETVGSGREASGRDALLEAIAQPGLLLE